jgi:N-succinyldiaminopimelate aminotransferase
VHSLVAIGETIRDTRAKLVDAFPGQRGELHRIGESVRKPPPTERGHGVDLVDDDFDRQILRTDVVEHRLDRSSLLFEPIIGCRRIDDVQDQIGDERLLERRRESFHELRRQPADEADRVGDQVVAAFVDERASRRIERLEQTIVDGNLSVRQHVQQRRLANVRVPGERDRRRFGAASFLATHFALLTEIAEPAAQESDASAREPAVGLELRLTGAAGADTGPERTHAAAEPLEVLPHTSHPRQVVLELRQLDLQLALGASRMLGEDVENQLRAVDDARLEGVFESALLSRLELVVDQEHLGARVPIGVLQLLELAFADIRMALGSGPVLHQLADRLDEGCIRELAQLGQLLLCVHSLGQHGHDEPALERGVRLALAHHRIMPPTGQNPTMQLSPALAATGTYPFVKLEQAKRELAAQGVELIDFGKGDPREPTDARIRQALADSLTEISTYPLAEGLPELRRAVADWCDRRFGVVLDPDTELIPTYGSKEAIFLLAQLIVDRDSDKRLVVTTQPGYPVPDRGAVFAGADVLQLPLLESNGFLPDLDAVAADTWQRTAIVWINYPNNPTGSVAPVDFLARLAELSAEHDFLLASDEAYTELWFDEPPRSALEVRDRGNVAVFNTLSKRSSMTGYRSGFIAAAPELIAALKQFRPSVGTAPQEFVQLASVVAWNDEGHVEQTREVYRRKREALLPTLRRKDVRLAGGAATMFLWLEVPGGARSEEFATRLLEHGLIVSPGTFFGPAGEGYWRMALVPTEDECLRAAEILEEVL